jgi:hypothetical protein
MKKNIFSLTALCFFAVSAIAQNNKTTSGVSICKNTSNSFTVAELEKCNMVLPLDEKLKVKSFLVSYLVTGKDGDVFIDVPVLGNNFSPAALNTLKEKGSQIKKVIIENVVAVDDTHAEKKISGTEIVIH